MSSIAVSIIVPVYNVEKYIERCACSLFEQTSDNIEYIFVNDGCFDKSLEILQKVMSRYPHRIPQVKILNHKTNQGVATARNTGLRHATGRYIGWVDSDDWVDNELFDVMCQLADDSDSDIVWCDFYNCFGLNEKEWIKDRQLCEEDSVALVRGLLHGQLHGSLCNSIVKRHLYVEHNILFSNDINLMEDKLVSIKLRYYAQKCTYLPNVYYYYNKMNTQSITSSPENETENLKDGIKCIRSIIAFLETGEKGIDFSQDFIHAKLAFKDYYFHSFTLQGFMIWQLVFPEANEYFLNSPATSFKNRLIGRMIVNDCWILLSLCIKLRNVIKYFYK